MAMKKILLAFVLYIQTVTAFSQSVYYECNIQTINKQLKQSKIVPLYEQGGHVIIPQNLYRNNNSNGLLIYHHVFEDEFYAYDVTCPKCKNNGIKSTLTMESCILAKCYKCYSEWQNISHGSNQNTNLSGEYPLTQNIVYKKGIKLIITDKIIKELLF